MSFPRKRTEVTDDCGVSSPDENDNTSTEIHQEARLLEEPEIPVGNASDADASNSDSSIRTAVDTEISRKLRESLEKLSEAYHKLPKSPKKKPYKRSKYDSKIHGEPSTRYDDSSDEIESIYLEKSPKKVRYAIKEETGDSVAGTSSGKSQNPEDNVDSNAEAGFTLVKTSDLIATAVSNSIYNQERLHSVRSIEDTGIIPQAGTSNEFVEIRPHAGTFNEDIEIRPHSGTSNEDIEIRPHAGTSNEDIEIRPHAGTSNEDIGIRPQAGTSNDDIEIRPHAGTSSEDIEIIPHAGTSKEDIEIRPHAGTSNEDTETIEHPIDSKACFAEKKPTRCRHSGKNKLLPHDLNKSEFAEAASNIFSQVPGIVNEGTSEQTTQPCNLPIDLLRTESNEDSNISTETMEFICEPSIDRRIETNTDDVEKMDYSSESCGAFESTKSGSERSTSVERMEFLISSSVGHDEEMESASAKSTDNEGMEYISESALSASESALSTSESVLYVRESVLYAGESVLYASESALSASESVLSANESVVFASRSTLSASGSALTAIESALTAIESVLYASESALSASEPISHQENVSTSNERTPIIEPNIDERVNTEREYIPAILVENENVISIESDSNSNEVTNINESNSDETIPINRQFSVPRVESSDTEDYEYSQNQGASNDTDSIIASTESTSDDQRPVAEIVPRIIVEEPSNSSLNTENKPSFKRKKSSDDSDDVIEGENVTNVTESTDIQGGTEASSIEFPDTDSDEYKERIYTESIKKFRKM